MSTDAPRHSIYQHLFVNAQMKDLAAAEHSVHTLLALDGYRTVYPRVSHSVMFSKTNDIARNIQEIATQLQRLQQK